MRLAKLLRYIDESPRLFAAITSVLIVTLALPDVVFRGASLRLTDSLFGSALGLHVRPVYPHFKLWEWWQGYVDNGGPLYQSEPMMEFMRTNLWSLNSPYWNPYSAAGSLGPETLVDLKFSVITIAYAILGGGSFTFNIIMLAAYWLGTYFVVRTAREKLELSNLACVAVGLVYLLNGYCSANFSNNYTQSYLLLPLCLFLAMHFVDNPTRQGLAGLSLSFTALLSITFLPTTILAVLTILTCTFGYWLTKRPIDIRAGVTAALSIAFALTMALATLAIIYLPFLESLQETGLLELYGRRNFFPAWPSFALSLFTPSHFLESYNARAPGPKAPGEATIYHFGVIGLCLAACAWARPSTPRNAFVAVLSAAALFFLGRIFDLPGFSQLLGGIPVFRNIASQYIWVAVAIPLVFLLGIGADNLLRGAAVRLPLIVVIVIGLASAVTLANTFSLAEPHFRFKVAALSGAAISATAALLAAWLLPKLSPRYRHNAMGVLIAALLVELIAGSKTFRFPPSGHFSNPPPDIVFLKSNIGHHRTMTIGAYPSTFPEGGSAFQIQEVTSENVGALLSYQAYFRAATKSRPGELRYNRLSNLSNLLHPLSLYDVADIGRLDYFEWRLIDLLGVKYIVFPRHYMKYRDAFAGSGFPIVFEDPATIIVENLSVLPRAFSIPIQNTATGSDVQLPENLANIITPVRIGEYRNAHVTLEGAFDEPRLVVLTDNWHPNWTALLNGVAVPIIRVNGTFRGIRVPPGDFRISMSYQPRTLPAAIVISSATALGLLVLLVIPRGRRRHFRTAEPGPTAAAPT